MSLRWRIALALAAVAAVVSVLAATGAYVSTARQLYGTIDDTLLDKVRDPDLFRPGPRFGGPPGAHRDDWGCPQPGRLQPASVVQLVPADAEVESCIAGTAALPVDDDDLALARDGGSLRLRTVSVDGTSYRVLTAPWVDGGAIQLARDLDEVHGVLGTLRVRLGALTFGCIALAGLLGWLVARRIVRPVIELRDTAESIADTQDLTTPIPAGGTGEIGSLAHSFTTMVQALATSREQQQRLITDASHEMRTPLTSLRTNLELLEYLDRLPGADRASILAAVQDDVGELTNLLAELVELATDRLSSDETPEQVELADLARDVAARAARRSGREIVVVDGAPAHVTVRPQMVERAIANLVDNAVKYSPAGQPIEVAVDGGRLEVRDHGPGITDDDQPYVFDRFYRSTEARSEPGSGLGLAIVKQIVLRHQGSVWARNRAEGGAAVGFQLPTGATIDSRASYTTLGDRLHGAPIIGTHG
jgi:two-component system, OmpR family, sensor histidine kinase MprB